MTTSPFDILLEEDEKQETQVEEPPVVSTRPDFVEAMPPEAPVEPQKKSFNLLDAIKESSAIMEQVFLPGAVAGKEYVKQIEEAEPITEARREELAGDVGYEGKDPEAATYVTALGQVGSGFGLEKEQVEEAYKSGVTEKSDGSKREVNFIYDEGANPLLFEGSLLMSVERDDGTFTPYGRPTAGFIDYTQSLVPFLAAETGASAAVVSTALTAGALTSKLGIAGKVASPFVTLATLYSGGVFTEKLRNEAAEGLGLKTDDDKNEFFNALKMFGDSMAAPFDFNLTEQEKLSGRLEVLFGGLPVTKQTITYISRLVSDKLRKKFEEVAINDDTFRSAVEADNFRRLHKLEKLLPSQISANKILNRMVGLADQVTNIIAYEFRKQNRALYEYVENVRAGKGQGDIKQFQNSFAKFKKDFSRLDLGEAGRVNAEMLLLFKDLRRLEAQELYRIAHDKIGFKSMDLTAIKNSVQISPKVIVPTSEADKIKGVQSTADWDDGSFNIIKEQLAILGKNNTLNRQQVVAGMKNFVDNVEGIDAVKQEYYKSPAKLLHLYSMKLGEMATDLIEAFPGGKNMKPGVKQRITELNSLRRIIQETIKNPVGADKNLLDSIKNDLNAANSFFKETEDLTSQELLVTTLSKATGNIQSTLKDIPTATIGRQIGTPSAEVPDIALEDLNKIQNYIVNRLKIIRTTKTQTDEAFAIKGKLRATRGKELSSEDFEGMTALKNAFRIQLASKLNKIATTDLSEKGSITAVGEYLDSFSRKELELLGISDIDEKLLRREASEVVRLENTLAREIAERPDTTQLGVAIGEIFADPVDIEGAAKSLLQVARREGIQNQGQAIENIKRGLIDYVFSEGSGVVVPVSKNSAYGEVGDYTIDSKKMGELIRLIKENKTLKGFFDNDTLKIMDGIQNYAQVIQATGADAGSALSGAQLISNLYTLDPAKFIGVVSRLGAQKLFSKILVKETLADAVLGKLKIAESGKDSLIKNMISTEGYIGAAMADAVLEMYRTDEMVQSQELFGEDVKVKSPFDVLLED